MHYHLEIVMPPTDDIEAAITRIMTKFDENQDEDDEEADYNRRYAFFDYWVMGGRWSGAKILALCGKEKLDEFHKKLSDHKITVSGLTFGKQTLQPSDQIPLVDRLWNETFPDSPVKVCPIFDNYTEDFGDVMQLKDIPEGLSCCHLIVAGMDYKDEGLEAKFMVQESNYNGVSFIDTKWDGTFKQGLELHADSMKNYKPEYLEKHLPKPDWIVVTIDYHS